MYCIVVLRLELLERAPCSADTMTCEPGPFRHARSRRAPLGLPRGCERVRRERALVRRRRRQIAGRGLVEAIVSGRPIERTVALDAGVEVGEHAIACAVVLLVH